MPKFIRPAVERNFVVWRAAGGYHSGRMIKALFLIFSAEATWRRIDETPRKWGAILATYVLPMVLLVSVAEGYGMAHWGKPRGQLTVMKHYSFTFIMVYEAVRFVIALATVLVAAKLIKSFAETFHQRHTFSQAFTLAAYGLSPYFLLRLLDAFPGVNPWVSWLIGILLSISILYSGVPLIMRPDPPHAFGLFLMTSMFLLILTGLLRFVTSWYLAGKFGKLDALINRLTN
jgi:hypothetical protein